MLCTWALLYFHPPAKASAADRAPQIWGPLYILHLGCQMQVSFGTHPHLQLLDAHASFSAETCQCPGILAQQSFADLAAYGRSLGGLEKVLVVLSSASDAVRGS